MILTYFDGAMRRKDERRAQKTGSHSLARARCFVAALPAESVSEFTQKLPQRSHTPSSGVASQALLRSISTSESLLYGNEPSLCGKPLFLYSVVH